MRLRHLALTLPALPFGLFADTAHPRPNILFIFCDDHAFQALGASGSDSRQLAQTPQINRIARDGMRFDRRLVTNSMRPPWPCKSIGCSQSGCGSPASREAHPRNNRLPVYGWNQGFAPAGRRSAKI